MASEWSSASLLDHYDSKSGLSKPSKYFGSGFPFLSFKDVFYNYFTPDRLTQLVQSSDMERENGSIKRGDVFLTRTSETMNELGMSSVALKNYENATFNGFTKRLRPKPDCPIYPEFIGYYLRSPQFRSEMLSFSTMSTRASLNNEMIGRLTIPIPPFIEQKKIAWTLMSLDQKIQLNRQTNQTLEQMAQALFKSWFVDFDPVIDNALAAGNPIPDALQERAERRQQQLAKPDHKPLPDDIHQLFPSEFELTEALGWVPKGWEVGIIENIASTNANSWSKITAPKQVVYVDLANTKNGHIQETTNYQFEDAPSRARRKLDKGDTIIGLVRPGNRSFAYIHDIGLTGSTGFAVMKPNSEKFRAYLYFHLTQNDVIDEFARLADGAAYPAIRPEVISNFMCLIPMASTLYLYQNIVGGFLEKIAIVSMENKQLKGIRDTLLPKLISGELRLPTDTTEQVHNSN